MIFDLIRKPQAAITESSELYRLLVAGAQTDAGVSVTSDSAMRASAVYACVLVIAETVAQVPLILYQRSDRQKSRAILRRLYTLLHDAPNSFQTSFDWRLTNTAFLCLRGNAYSFISRSASGQILELLPMVPDRVEVKQNKDYSLSYAFTDNDGVRIPLQPNQVFRLTGLSFDGINGISPIEYHRQTIGLGLAADKHSALAFKNGAKMNGILRHPGRFKDADIAKRVRESWDEAFSGGNSFKTPLLEEGMEWQQVSMTNRDAQYIQVRTFQIEEIARLFRCPPHKIGHLERSTNNNIEQQALEFVTDTMMPWFVRWEQAIMRDLIGIDNARSLFAEFLVTGLLRGDSKSRSDYYTSGITNGWLSANEVRALENMNPRDGGDSYLMPLNMTVSTGGNQNG